MNHCDVCNIWADVDRIAREERQIRLIADDAPHGVTRIAYNAHQARRSVRRTKHVLVSMLVGDAYAVLGSAPWKEVIADLVQRRDRSATRKQERREDIALLE